MLTKLSNFVNTPIDLRPLGLYRIGLGLIISVLLTMWGPHWTELFSNEGFHLDRLSSWAPAPNTSWALLIALSVSTFLMTIGIFTRVATAVTLLIFAFLYCLDSINERALSSIILVNLTIGLCSPWGNYCSLSSWQNGKTTSTSENYGNPLYTRLWQVELLQMYFFSGLIKTIHTSWIDGSVLKQIFMGRWSRTPGLWLSQVLPDLVYPILTVGTIVFELLLPFLFFSNKTRFIAVLLGLLFHLAIQTTLYIELLGMHSMLCLLVFFWPEGRWDYRPTVFSWLEGHQTKK